MLLIGEVRKWEIKRHFRQKVSDGKVVAD